MNLSLHVFIFVIGLLTHKMLAQQRWERFPFYEQKDCKPDKNIIWVLYVGEQYPAYRRTMPSCELQCDDAINGLQYGHSIHRGPGCHATVPWIQPSCRCKPETFRVAENGECVTVEECRQLRAAGKL